MFDYSRAIYILPVVAAVIVYARWFFGPQWRQSPGVFSRNPIALPLLGLVALYVVQMLNGVPWNPVVSVGGFVYHLGTVPLFFIAASGFRDGREIRGVLWFVVGLALFECTYGLAQYYLGPPEALALSQHFHARMVGEAWWTPGSSELVYRPTGLTLNGGGPGMYGLIGVLLVLGLFEGWHPRRWRKLALLLGVLVMLVTILLSAVRAFWLGLLVALLVFGVLEGFGYLAAVAGLGWAAAALAVTWTRGALYIRLSTLLSPWAVFSRERGSELLSLPQIVAQYPAGIGLGRVAGSAAGEAKQLFPEGSYGFAHNYWVSLAWEASILAPLLLVLLLSRLAAFGFSVYRRTRDRESRGVVAAILALDAGIVAITFAGPALAGLASSLAQYFWFLSGLLFAISGRSVGTSTGPITSAESWPDARRRSGPATEAL